MKKLATISILLLGLIQISIASQCEPKNQEIFMALTVGEQVKIPLSQLFKNSNLVFQLQDNTNLGVIAQYNQTDIPRAYVAQDNGEVFYVTQSQKNLKGMNQIIFSTLNGTQTKGIQWARRPTYQQLGTPYFNFAYSLEYLVNTSCPSLVLLNETTVVADCFETIQHLNSFILINYASINTAPQIFTQNLIGYQSVTNRVTRVLTQQLNQNVSSSYLFRGVPCGSSTPDLCGKSAIEVYGFDQSGQPIFTGSIFDVKQLAQFNLTTFSLVNFITTDNQIYILDQTNGLFSFQFSYENTTANWTANGWVNNTLNKTAIDFAVNQLPTKVSQIVIFYDDRYEVYTLQQGSSSPILTQTKNLPFTISKVGQFGLTQNYVHVENVENQTLYSFSLLNDQIIQSALPTGNKVVFNQFYDIITQLDRQQSSQYYLTQGYLYVKNSSNISPTQQIVLNSTIDTDNCSIKISYSIYAKNDTNLYNYGSDQHSPFPSFIDYPNYETTDLNFMVSGPNQQYLDQTPAVTKTNLRKDREDDDEHEHEDDDDKKKIKNEIIFLDSVVLNTNVFKNITFTQLLSPKQSNNFFYHIVQTKDINYPISVWKCQIQPASITLSPQSTCSKIGEDFQQDFQVTPDTFESWTFSDQITMVIKQTNSTLRVVVCNSDSKCSSPSSFFNPYGAIKSFTVQENFLWVISELNPNVSIYDMGKNYTLLNTISQQSLSQLGFTGILNPSNLYSNKNADNQIVIVDNQNELLVFSMSGSLITLNSVIQLPPQFKSKPSDIGIGDKTFFVSSHFYQTVQEYNFEDLSNVYLKQSHNLSDYGYQFNQSQSSPSSSNGFYSIRVVSIYDQTKKYVVVFEPNVQARDSIHKVFPVTGELFSLGGDTQSNYIYSDGNVTRFLIEPRFYIQIKLIGVTPVQSRQYGFKVYNQNNSISFTSNKFQIQNTNTDIFIPSQKNQKFLFHSTNETQYISLQSDFINGQIIRYNISCKDCWKNITIQNQLEPLKNNFKLGQSTGFSLKNQTLFIQQNQNITIHNGVNETQIQLPIAQNMNCSLIAADILIVSICRDNINAYAYITDGDLQYKDSVLLPNIQQPTKISLNGLNLVILDSGVVKVFRLNQANQNYTVNQTYTFDSLYFNSEVIINDFNIYQVNNDWAKLTLTDKNYGLRMIEFTGSEWNLIASNIIDIVNLMISQQMLHDDQTFFLGAIIFDQQLNANTYTFKAAVVSNKVSHLVLFIVQDANNKSSITSTLGFALNRYTWDSLSTVAYFNSTIYTAYYQGNQVLLAQYSIDQKINLAYASMKSGYIFNLTTNQINSFQVAFTNNTVFINSDESLQINPSTDLVIQNGDKLRSQTITLTASNTFSNQTQQFKLQNADLSDDDDKWHWWYTLFIILGVALIFGIGAFVVYKRKQPGVKVGGDGNQRLLGNDGNVQFGDSYQSK